MRPDRFPQYRTGVGAQAGRNIHRQHRQVGGVGQADGLRKGLAHGTCQAGAEQCIHYYALEHGHSLRLRIKRVRYGLEAYPHDCSIPGSLLAPLKAAQSALGDWHDLEQWLLRCQREPDLAPVREVWTARFELARERAGRALSTLQQALAEH
ncbi:CHAD domain-containing protein [Pseudomonas aeruginosa]|nr:CHAD domain-containing protein [Pseudomonas aeruginosa]